LFLSSSYVKICSSCKRIVHRKEVISDLRTTFRKEIHKKLDVIQTNQKKLETGFTTFDLNVTSIINELKEEGTKLKAMVDHHIEKMIATLKEKASNEKEPGTKMLSECKQQLEKANEIDPVSCVFPFGMLF
jgi:uncharacterized protein YicC (UPF0701 family)